MDEKLRNAYEAGSRILREELEPRDRELLEHGSADELIVVRGCYDRVEDLLRLAGIAHQVIEAEAVAGLQLRSDQMVVVNCPGKMPASAVEKLSRFVWEGGTLFTTDGALKHVVEPGFPGRIEYNGQSTGDEVVAVRAAEGHDAGLLAGLVDHDAEPIWWLEGASYPIRILDHDGVTVLLWSRELGERHGEPAVAVTFDHGAGRVIHAISHYYLQRAELRTALHTRSWKKYAEERGASSAADSNDLDHLNSGEVEAAHRSLRFLTNAVLESKRRAPAQSPRSNTAALPLRIERGHLVVTLPEGLALLDTGSPVSLGRSRRFSFGVATYSAAQAAGLFREVEQQLGVQLDFLIGMDVLRTQRLDVDAARGVLRLDRAPRAGLNTSVSHTIGGIPLVDVTAAGKRARAILDTGAMLSYMPGYLAADATLVGAMDDYLPGYGAFSTSVYEIPVDVCDTRMNLRCGVLPNAIAGMIAFLGADWILGSQLFSEHRVHCDFNTGRLSLPHAQRVAAV